MNLHDVQPAGPAYYWTQRSGAHTIARAAFGQTRDVYYCICPTCNIGIRPYLHYFIDTGGQMKCSPCLAGNHPAQPLQEGLR